MTLMGHGGGGPQEPMIELPREREIPMAPQLPPDLLDQLEDLDAALEAVIWRYEFLIAALDGVDVENEPA